MKHMLRKIAVVLAAICVFFSFLSFACSPVQLAVPTSTPEPTAIPTPTATPTATPTPSPSPTPTPEPYFDLENMTDEELLSAYGIPIEGTYLIGYATDDSGILVVEYIADDIKCMTMVECGREGKKWIMYEYPLSYYTHNTLMSTDEQTFHDALFAISDGINNHDLLVNVHPFPGELLIGENEVKNVMITRTIFLSDFYRYLELQGLSVPETKWSQDIEGVEMHGNVVSILGMFRYFLTVAPHDEVMNHIKLNYPDTAKIITEGP